MILIVLAKFGLRYVSEHTNQLFVFIGLALSCWRLADHGFCLVADIDVEEVVPCENRPL